MNETVQGTPAAPRPFNWMNVALWVAVAFILVVLGVGLVNSQVSRPDDVAPDFEMQFFNGYEWEGRTAASLSDFRGKVVVLNFWASWCVECLLEAELLENTWREYQDRDVLFVGVAYIDAEPKSYDYLEQFAITYPNAPDLRSAISAKYDITGVPETFFIDRNGRVAYSHLGPLDEQTLAGVLEQLVAQPVSGLPAE